MNRIMLKYILYLGISLGILSCKSSNTSLKQGPEKTNTIDL